MTIERLFELIRSTDLIPVPVNHEGTNEDSIYQFDGDLNGFLATAKAIGSKTIFVMSNFLEDGNFFSESAIDSEENPKQVNLAKISPSLARFKKNLGEVYCYFLLARGGASDLGFVVNEDWVSVFENEWELADAKFQLDQQTKSSA